jgi:hypothetical protein
MAEKSIRAFPVSAGLLQHKPRIGAAIWEYLWLLDHVTSDEPHDDGTFLGVVQFGNPVGAERIAHDLMESVETAKANLRKLADAGYVRRKLVVGGGYIYTVINSKKWHWKRNNSHRVENPSKEKLSNDRVENYPMNGKKPFDDRVENYPINKEVREVLLRLTPKLIHAMYRSEQKFRGSGYWQIQAHRQHPGTAGRLPR